MHKLRLGISACLSGEQVRYDGGDKFVAPLVNALSGQGEWISVCPEVECGLPVPREAMHLESKPEGVRLLSAGGIDHTDLIVRWLPGRLQELTAIRLCGFVFKSGSPSCGLGSVSVWGGPETKADGIFAAAFRERFPMLPVINDLSMQDPATRNNFLQAALKHARSKL